MEAVVTLKATVAELELIKRAMAAYSAAKREEYHTKGAGITPGSREKARAESVLASNLLDRLS